MQREGELQSGDRMSAEEFHRVYRRMPEDFKAELVGGIVYVASPVKLPHATCHPALTTVFFLYAGRTPGLQTGENGTLRLGEDSQPQPDLFLRILPEHGGRSRTGAGYVEGPPELVAEVAHSTRAIDYHAKMADYGRHGVLEYLIVSLRDGAVELFDLSLNQNLPAGGDGLLRSRVFPGLWIDPRALLVQDASRLLSALDGGMATPEYRDFREKLSARKGR
jgi:hypothetical protein